MDTDETEVLQCIRLGIFNSRSVKIKDYIIIEELEGKNWDTLLITDTWLKNMDAVSAWLNQSVLTRGNFSMTKHNRPGDEEGGGIALMHRSQHIIRLLETGNTNTIEYAIWKLNYKSKPVYFLGILSPTTKQY